MVGYVGRFTYAKNHEFLITVFEEIAKHNDNVLLLLVGDGELHDSIISRLKELRLYDKAILVGKTCDTEHYYRVMDVMVLPSRFEGLSMTTVESLACDVLCVISETIPDEALISDNYKYLSLNYSAETWGASRCRDCRSKRNIQ